MKTNESNGLIQEYEAKEADIIRKLIDTFMKSQCAQFSPLDLYPELKLIEPYTCGNLLLGQPLWAILPYYSNILLYISPDWSEEKFLKEYGLGINTLLELHKDGKVALILDLPPDTELSDYLRPLYEEGLNKGFPTYKRISILTHFFGKSFYDESIREGALLFKGTSKKLHPIHDHSEFRDVSTEKLKDTFSINPF
jgi:hypothetical protein